MSRKLFKKKEKLGFTLIELLVVIAIIGLLSSMVVAALGPARAKARNAKRKAELRQLELALQLYYDANGRYPLVIPPATTYAEGRCSPPPFGWSNQPDYSGVNAWIPDLAPTYISVLPGDPSIDPVLGRCYVYFSDTGQRYYIMAHFGAENPYDANDSMLRIIAPACTVTQNTFYVADGFGRCF